MSSENLDKYEYFTGEDLNYKPSTVEQARFDYSPLRFFNKGLKEKDKKEGLLSEEQLKAIKNKTDNMKKVTTFVEEPLRLEANALTDEIKSI